MDRADDNKNEILTDDELEKVTGGALNCEKSFPCRCGNRIVKKIVSYNVTYYRCENCGGYIPSRQIEQ